MRRVLMLILIGLAGGCVVQICPINLPGKQADNRPAATGGSTTPASRPASRPADEPTVMDYMEWILNGRH